MEYGTTASKFYQNYSGYYQDSHDGVTTTDAGNNPTSPTRTGYSRSNAGSEAHLHLNGPKNSFSYVSFPGQPTGTLANEQGYSSVAHFDRNDNPQYVPRMHESYNPNDDTNSRPMTSPLLPGAATGSTPVVPAPSTNLRGGVTGVSALASGSNTTDIMGDTVVFDPHSLSAATTHTGNQSAVFVPNIHPHQPPPQDGAVQQPNKPPMQSSPTQHHMSSPQRAHSGPPVPSTPCGQSGGGAAPPHQVSPGSPPHREHTGTAPVRKPSPSGLGHMRRNAQTPGDPSRSPAQHEAVSAGSPSGAERRWREQEGARLTHEASAARSAAHSAQLEELTAAAEAASYAWDGGIAAARLAAVSAENHDAVSPPASPRCDASPPAAPRDRLPPGAIGDVAPTTPSGHRGPVGVRRTHAEPDYAGHASTQGHDRRAPVAASHPLRADTGGSAYATVGDTGDGSTGGPSRGSITVGLPAVADKGAADGYSHMHSAAGRGPSQHAQRAHHVPQMLTQQRASVVHPQATEQQQHPQAPPPSFPTYNMLSTAEDMSGMSDTVRRGPDEQSSPPHRANQGRSSVHVGGAQPYHQNPASAQMHAASHMHTHPQQPMYGLARDPPQHPGYTQSHSLQPSRPTMYAPPVDRIGGGKVQHLPPMHGPPAAPPHESGMRPQPRPQSFHAAPHPGTDTSIATVRYDPVEGGLGGAAMPPRPETQSTIPNGEEHRPWTVRTIPNDPESRPGTSSYHMPGTESTVPYLDYGESHSDRPQTVATVQYSPPPTVDPIIAGMAITPGIGGASAAAAEAAAAAASADVGAEAATATATMSHGGRGGGDSPAEVAVRSAARMGPHAANPTARAMEKQRAAETALFAQKPPSLLQHLPGGHVDNTARWGEDFSPHAEPTAASAVAQPSPPLHPPHTQPSWPQQCAGVMERPAQPSADMFSGHARMMPAQDITATAPVGAMHDMHAYASAPGQGMGGGSPAAVGSDSDAFGTPTASDATHTLHASHAGPDLVHASPTPTAAGALHEGSPPAAGGPGLLSSTLAATERYVPESPMRPSHGSPSERSYTQQRHAVEGYNGQGAGIAPRLEHPGGGSQAELSPAKPPLMDETAATTRPGIGPDWFTPPSGPVGAAPLAPFMNPPRQSQPSTSHSPAVHGSRHSSFMRDAPPSLDYAADHSSGPDVAGGGHRFGARDVHGTAGSQASSMHAPTSRLPPQLFTANTSVSGGAAGAGGSRMHGPAYASSHNPASTMTDQQMEGSQKSVAQSGTQNSGQHTTCKEMMYNRPRVALSMAAFVIVLVLIIIIMFVVLIQN